MLLLVAALGLCAMQGGAQHAAARHVDALAAGFQTPPDSAKPLAYWWWLNGNVSREGITKDLEEMKRQRPQQWTGQTVE